MANIFDVEIRALGNGNELHFIHIEVLDKSLIRLLDERIVSICEGCAITDLGTIKKRIIDNLSTKKATNLEFGAIAEFFSHLYLGELGFKQEFLYLNLEDRSIKKGFDGYYSKDEETWIYESKSGLESTDGASHQEKVKQAYGTLKGKILGDVENNPWQNAYNHASHIDVRCDVSIRNQLKIMANDFVMGKYQKIEDFNIIPGSTIFLDVAWSRIDSDSLEKQLGAIVKEFHFRRINIVCINQSSVQLFWNYLEN